MALFILRALLFPLLDSNHSIHMRPLFFHAIVLLAFGGTASAATYYQSFSFPDGTTNLGDGSVLATGGGTTAPSVQGGQLQLTTLGSGGGTNSFSIPAISGSSLGWSAVFRLTFIDAAGGNPPADGLSFNYGSAVVGALGAAEEGMGGADAPENLSFEVDTWMNFDAEQGVNISGNHLGADVGQLAFTNGPILNDGGVVSGLVILSWDPLDGASFHTTGLLTDANFSNVATSFTPSDNHTFNISARVGGANETVLIDDLFITTVPETSTVALLGASGMGLLLRRRRR
ncbi:MAG: hypothetical protein JWM59_4326 [Verrucomicrobiales bacterium]|nr:hypothetical protein [Verrucomicrobiales bacterium]